MENTEGQAPVPSVQGALFQGRRLSLPGRPEVLQYCLEDLVGAPGLEPGTLSLEG